MDLCAGCQVLPEECFSSGARAARGGIEVEGLAKHVRDAGVFFDARDVFEDVAHAVGLGEVEVLD